MIKSLPDKVKISGDLRVKHWKKDLEIIRSDFENNDLWSDIFDNYFIKRINTRYVNLISSIEELKAYKGEGFSIMTLACALIEFLETTYQGKIFTKLSKAKIKESGRDPKNYYGLGRSKAHFKNYLLTKKPFCDEFKSDKAAQEFYENVRCGLLHEATLLGNWTINIKKETTDRIVTKTNEQTLLNRINFIKSLNGYLKEYKSELLKSKDLKEAFITKYNGLCERHEK